jgi:hydrogenase accessory protein HypB
MPRIELGQKVLNENARIASGLRQRFREHGIQCLNLISSPGSGKTSLLERTLDQFPKTDRVAVLTGDIQTENDATRLRRFGFPVKQITTGGTCYLDALMIEHHLEDWRGRRSNQLNVPSYCFRAAWRVAYQMKLHREIANWVSFFPTRRFIICCLSRVGSKLWS